MTITYTYLGLNVSARYSAEIDERDAYLTIGSNTVAGFEPVRYTHDAADRPLRTPSGELLTVVALTGVSGVLSALAFTGGR